MRAVTGEINESCFIHFSVEIQGTVPSGVWTGEKSAIRGSTSTAKGKFKAIENDFTLPDKAFVNYRDITNNVQIILKENKMAPLSRIRIGLPNPDKYVTSEFFVKGHFEIERVNVISAKKTFDGEAVMKHLRNGEAVNLLDKLFFEKQGEALIKLEKLSTSLGVIEQIKTTSNLEI